MGLFLLHHVPTNMKSISECNTLFIFQRKNPIIFSNFFSFDSKFINYLLKGSITHNKKQIPLFNSLVNYISARSAYKTFSVKDKCIFRFSNFVIKCLFSSLGNSWFYIFLFLIPLPEVLALEDFLSKSYKPLKHIFDIHHILEF